MINILTITLGREKYLKDTLFAVNRNYEDTIPVQHTIVCLEARPSADLCNFISNLNYSGNINLQFHENRMSVGKVLETYKNKIKYDKFLKLDDDAEIISNNFFIHAKAVFSLKPNSIFSPFPVGLINNLGGIRGSGHEVKYFKDTDTFYTLRRVDHVGGFARFCDTSLIQECNFSDAHNEDIELSGLAKRKGVELFYLENAMIVEHKESTLGQHQRYGEDYFKGRF